MANKYLDYAGLQEVVSKLKQYTDDVEIGGTNFLLNSAESKTGTYVDNASNNGYTDYWYFSQYGTSLTRDNTTDIFVVSFDYECFNVDPKPSGTPYIYAQLNNAAITNIVGDDSVYEFIHDPSQKGRYVRYFKLSSAQSTYSNSFRIRVNLRNTVDGAYVVISNIKCEKGTKVSTWTPSPEDYGNAKIFSGTCSTAGATAVKEVTCPNFTSSDLVTGAVIFVTFTTTNSAAVADLRLNVNNTGEKNLYQLINTTYGNITSAGQLRKNQTYCFHYDGSAWTTILNYNNSYSSMTQAEADTGTATNARSISATVLSTTIANKISAIPDATTTASGHMSAEDKSKLDITNTFYQAVPSANTSCSAGTLTQVTLATENLKSGTTMSISSGGIKVTEAGKYRISAGYSCNTMNKAITKVSFTIRKGSAFSGSSIVHQLTMTVPAQSANWTSVYNVSSKIVYIEANSIIFLGANLTGGTGTIASGTDTYLLVERVA